MEKQGLFSGKLLNHQVVEAAGKGHTSFPAVVMYWQKAFQFQESWSYGPPAKEKVYLTELDFDLWN